MAAHSFFFSLFSLVSLQKRWLQRTPSQLKRSLPKVSCHAGDPFSPFFSLSGWLQASAQPGPCTPPHFLSLSPQREVETLKAAARGTRIQGDEHRAVLPSTLLPAKEISWRNLWGHGKAAELPASLQTMFLFCSFPCALSELFRRLDCTVIHLSWINFYLY